MKRAEDAKFAGKPVLNSENVPEQFEEVESFLRTCERTDRFFYLCGIAEGRVLDKFIKNEDPVTLSDFLEGMKKFHERRRAGSPDFLSRGRNARFSGVFSFQSIVIRQNI